LLLLKRAHVAQDALGSVGARLVWMTATFALTIDVFAFAIWQVLQQVLQSALAPIWQFGCDGHRLDLFHDGLANELRPVAAGAVDVWNRADVGASRAVVGAARFLLHVDVEATILFIAFSATNTETAHAAFLGHFEAGRRWNGAEDFALVVQFAVILEAGDDVGHWKPQTLAPSVVLTESSAGFRFFGFDAGGTFFIRVKRMTTTFATTVQFDTISFRHHLQEFLVGNSAPIGNIGTERASFENLGEHAPTTTDHRRWR